MPTSAKLLQLAMRYHQGGNVAQAENLYRQVLQAEPHNVNALHFLGILANQAGRHDLGIPLLRQAIALNPAVPDLHNNLGLGLFEFGNNLFTQGHFAQAADAFRQTLSINPHQAETHNNLGNALFQQGQYVDAAECYRQALLLNPSFVDAHNNLGNALFQQNRPAEAAICFEQALLLNPDYCQAYFNLGNVCFAQGKFAISAQCFQQALRWIPDNADAYNNLGNALFHQELFEEALVAYRQALCLKPEFAEAYNNLGNACVLLGQFQEAFLGFQQALRLKPNSVDTLTNLGNAFGLQGKLAEAEACYQQALDIDPENNLARWKHSFLHLLQGDFEKGWRDFAKSEVVYGIVPRSYHQPRWDGSPLEGKTILVYAERGLGDTLQFVRYVPMIQKRGGQVLLECQPALVDMLARQFGEAILVPAGAPLPPFDLETPLFNLPCLFGTTLATIPADVPYLTADSNLVHYWGQKIRRAPRQKPTVAANEHLADLTIGIAWQGSMIVKNDRRSLPMAYFETLAREERVRLISLQVGPGCKQLEAAAFHILDLGLKSMDDLGGTMMNLDLVISVDTAVAHLAGALGVPVWTLLHFAPDWRWLLERSDCPWYPTMRLFRQDRLDDWQGVFERVVAEIRKL